MSQSRFCVANISIRSCGHLRFIWKYGRSAAVAETDKDAAESTGKEYIFPCTCNLLTIVKLQTHICISDAERDGEGELTSDAESTEYETDNESDEDAE